MRQEQQPKQSVDKALQDEEAFDATFGPPGNGEQRMNLAEFSEQLMSNITGLTQAQIDQNVVECQFNIVEGQHVTGKTSYYQDAMKGAESPGEPEESAKKGRKRRQRKRKKKDKSGENAQQDTDSALLEEMNKCME